MTKKYTNDELIALLNANEDEKLYTQSCLNYKGDTREGIPCVEALAQNISFNDIKAYESDLKEDFTYIRKKKEIDTKSEKGLCRYWFNCQRFDEKDLVKELGTPLQYEINLVKNKKVNIDLVSLKDNTLFLIEVKGRGPTGTHDPSDGYNYYSSQESILRCALEIRTYYKTIQMNINKFKEDMNVRDAEVKMAILIPENSVAAIQHNDRQTYPYANRFVDGDNSLENPEIKVVLYKGRKRTYKKEVI